MHQTKREKTQRVGYRACTQKQIIVVKIKYKMAIQATQSHSRCFSVIRKATKD